MKKLNVLRAVKEIELIADILEFYVIGDEVAIQSLKKNGAQGDRSIKVKGTFMLGEMDKGVHFSFHIENACGDRFP